MLRVALANLVLQIQCDRSHCSYGLKEIAAEYPVQFDCQSSNGCSLQISETADLICPLPDYVGAGQQVRMLPFGFALDAVGGKLKCERFVRRHEMPKLCSKSAKRADCRQILLSETVCVGSNSDGPLAAAFDDCVGVKSGASMLLNYKMVLRQVIASKPLVSLERTDRIWFDISFEQLSPYRFHSRINQQTF